MVIVPYSYHLLARKRSLLEVGASNSERPVLPVLIIRPWQKARSCGLELWSCGWYTGNTVLSAESDYCY